jgi:hypothetical protein
VPFIGNILPYKSLAIVGMDKNTGKTECLNYVIKRLKDSGKKIALTSIGVDGETTDSVTQTAKPAITVYKNMVFITSEKHYKTKQIVSEILHVGQHHTALGRLITARALSTGQVLFSGPSTTTWLKQEIERMQQYQVDTTIVDGALSRMSLGSPVITQSMILTTGAALSPSMSGIVQKTRFLYNLLQLETFETPYVDMLSQVEQGVYELPQEQPPRQLQIPSILLLDQFKDALNAPSHTYFVAGAIGDKLLNYLRIQKNIEQTTLIARDFTKFFISPAALHAFIKRGGTLKVLLKPVLLAICVNPVSPQGFTLKSNDLCQAIQQHVHVPVYDIRKI